MSSKSRYFTVIKADDKWQHTDQRGYKDIDHCRFNAIELSKRNGGTEIGIMFAGKVDEIYFGGGKF